MSERWSGGGGEVGEEEQLGEGKVGGLETIFLKPRCVRRMKARAKIPVPK